MEQLLIQRKFNTCHKYRLIFRGSAWFSDFPVTWLIQLFLVQSSDDSLWNIDAYVIIVGLNVISLSAMLLTSTLFYMPWEWISIIIDRSLRSSSKSNPNVCCVYCVVCFVYSVCSSYFILILIWNYYSNHRISLRSLRVFSPKAIVHLSWVYQRLCFTYWYCD